MLQWRISRHWHSPIKLGRYSSKYQNRNLSVSSHWSNCMWTHRIFFAFLDFIFRKCQSRRTLQSRLSTRVTSHYLQSMEKFAARNTWCQYSDSCHNSQNKDATDWRQRMRIIKLKRSDIFYNDGNVHIVTLTIKGWTVKIIPPYNCTHQTHHSYSMI